MVPATRLPASDAIVGREQEFYWLWILATVAYGVGDIVTTVTIVEFGDRLGVREQNVLMQRVVDSFGQYGIIGLKLAVFFSSLAVSLYAAERLDWPLYYMPPVVLIAVGTVVTLHNLRLFVA